MEPVQSFAADMPPVSKIPLEAPWKWLASGWKDMVRAPQVSIAYGVVFTAISLFVFAGLYLFGWTSLLLPLIGGFLLVGPFMAVGLYETSRRLEEGEEVNASQVMKIGAESPGQLAYMGIFLLIIYFVWMEIALLLFMLFLGPQSLQLANIVPTLLFTWNGLGLLIIGTAAGALLATFVFAVTAVSIPLLMRRRVDFVTASLTSVQAVASNPAPMALWAVLIAGMMALASATMFLGMIIVFPLIGHATWHAYKDILRAPKKAGKKSGK